jgi:GT2 family glycosyltransferase
MDCPLGGRMKLSVVITLGRRTRSVRDVIVAIGRQDLPRQDFEVVFVDRTPDRWYAQNVADLASQFGVTCSYLLCDDWSRARSQNIGLAAAAHEIVLFICEDFHPPRSLFGAHLDFHRRHPEPWRAVTGPAARAQEAQTPLTMWLEREVAPFRPPAGEEIDNVSPHSTSFSNLSIKRAFLLEHGSFDAAFPTEGFDDIELALRLHGQGLRVSYDAALEVIHDHEVDLDEHLLRWQLSARGARRFDEKHPGLRPNRVPQDATMSVLRARLACAASWLAMRFGPGAARRERYYLKRTQLAFLLGYRAPPGRVAFPDGLN